MPSVVKQILLLVNATVAIIIHHVEHIEHIEHIEKIFTTEIKRTTEIKDIAVYYINSECLVTKILIQHSHSDSARNKKLFNDLFYLFLL